MKKARKKSRADEQAESRLGKEGCGDWADQWEMVPDYSADFGGRAPEEALLKTTLFTDE